MHVPFTFQLLMDLILSHQINSDQAGPALFVLICCYQASKLLLGVFIFLGEWSQIYLCVQEIEGHMHRPVIPHSLHDQENKGLLIAQPVQLFIENKMVNKG